MDATITRIGKEPDFYSQNLSTFSKQSSQLLHFQRRQQLYQAGDVAQSIYRVREGLVRITRMTPEGRVLTVRHVVPNDFFGEEAFAGDKREEVAEALTDTVLEAFMPDYIDHPALLTITQSLSRQMQRLMDYEYHLQTGDLRQRVARYLLTLSETPLAAHNEHGNLVIYATHELLAEGTASTRESVSKIITELRGEGYIQSGYRSITLSNVVGLCHLAQVAPRHETS